MLARRHLLLVLTAILVVAAGVRFGGLGAKPLWLDEAMTTLISLGRGPDDIPLGVALPLSSLTAIFSVHPTATWRDVVARLMDPAVQHTHPPLFYLISHAWLTWRPPSLPELAWAARAVSAALGVGAVALTFGMARAAFGVRAGLIAAALAAVCPLAVIHAQEARNYTLPMALVTAGLWALVAIVGRLTAHRPVPGLLWAAWAATNALGCYAHYYGTLTFAAQAATLGLVVLAQRSRRALAWLVAATGAVALAFLPWAATLATHSVSPEQRWMRLKGTWLIVYETLTAWQAMILGKRWETPIPGVMTASKVFAIVFGLWVLALLAAGLVRRLRAEPRHPAAYALLVFGAITVVELFAGSLLLGKNLALKERYHLLYYPAIAALLAWVLAGLPGVPAAAWHARLLRPARRTALVAILAVGGLNSVLIGLGLQYSKPMDPDRVGAAMAGVATPPVLLAIGSGSFHETVATLTYLIELSRRSPAAGETSFAFVRRADRYPDYGEHLDPAIFWTHFARLRGIDRRPTTLWVDGMGLWPQEYPDRLEVGADRQPCAIHPRERERPAPRTAGDGRWRPPFRLYLCPPPAAAVPSTLPRS